MPLHSPDHLPENMKYDFSTINNILVIKMREIGDVLLTVPVFRALRENFPHALIAGLVYSGTEETLTGNPLIDEVLVFNRDIKKLSIFRKSYEELLFLKKIRSMKFDMVIDLTSGDRPALISYFSGAGYRIAYEPDGKGFSAKRHLYTHLVTKKGNQHTVLKNLDLVRHFGIDTHNLSVDFYTDEKARSFVKNLFIENNFDENSKIVHIHPLSRLFVKCWEDENMAKVITWLLNKNIKVVITSSPDKKEVEKIKKILSFVHSDRYSQNILDLSGETTIKELAAISEASSLFFGIDSAPMHIAAAVCTPVIALFGHGATRWSPWGDGHHVISHNRGNRNGMSKGEVTRKNLLKIHPDEVIDALEKELWK